MAGQKRKGLSFGTIAMLILTGLVLAGSVLLFLRWGGGRTVDFSRLGQQVSESGSTSAGDAGSP